jgi:hypothetical protein
LGNEKDPKIILVSASLSIVYMEEIKCLLTKFKDIFAWSYKESRGIPREMCEHKIELMTMHDPSNKCNIT